MAAFSWDEALSRITAQQANGRMSFMGWMIVWQQAVAYQFNKMTQLGK